PDFNPHVTLYDGASRMFAEAVVEILGRYPFSAEFPISELLPLEAGAKGQSSLDLLWSFDGDLVEHVLSRRLEADDLRELDNSQRLDAIEGVARYLASLSTSAATVSPT